MTETLAFYITVLRKDFAGFCDTHLQEMGVSQGLLFFLIYIGKHPGCAPGELSGAIKADTGHTTRSVDKLVQSGMVSRCRAKEDRRSFTLSLTDKGQQAFEQIHNLFGEWDRQVLGDMDEEEKQRLFLSLSKLMKGGPRHV